MKFYDDPDTASTWMVGFISLLLIVVTILLLQVVYYDVLTDEIASKRPQTYAVEELLQSQTAQIERGVRWVDKEHGLVGMPIEMAMELVVESHQGSGSGR